MAVLKHLVIILGLVFSACMAMAQPPRNAKPKPKETAPVKYVLPKLKTALGNQSDTIVNVSVDEATQLILLPLIITDAKKTAYAISSYQCMYKRRGVTEDEESGKVTPVKSMVTAFFRTTPLSEVWKKTITEELKSGEEIFFYDIVVKDADGRLLFAPNLKLLVK